MEKGMEHPCPVWAYHVFANLDAPRYVILKQYEKGNNRKSKQSNYFFNVGQKILSPLQTNQAKHEEKIYSTRTIEQLRPKLLISLWI